MDEATADLLVSEQGLSLLESLPRYDERSSLGLGERLRAQGADPRLVAAALTQSQLRARGESKLGDLAHDLLLTRDGLEQATRAAVAQRHARRFRDAGVSHVLDLGCGLGTDAWAMADLGLAVTAVDADRVTATLAAHNLRGFPHARVQLALAEDLELPDSQACGTVGAWLDPSRRKAGVADVAGRTRRVFSLAGMSPSWEFVQSVAARVPATGAKLGPAFPHAELPPGAEGQWVSVDGELVECAVWWGPLVDRPGRSATVLTRGGEVSLGESDVPDSVPVAEALPLPGSWIHEADPAVIRAGLTGALARSVDGKELAPGVGYVVSDRLVRPGYAKAYQVIEAIPMRTKQVRAWLRARGVGRLTLKKRGVALDPDEVRRALRPSGSEELTAILTRVGTQPVFIAVTPAPPAD